jgi:glycosyltransferase involved in cell wall biosynthesis
MLRVVHACAYFAPAFVYGGPPRSVLGLCQAEQQAGIDVRVVTTTANGETELPREIVETRQFDGVTVDYCERAWPKAIFNAPSFDQRLRDATRGADLIHIHGLWNAVVWRAAAVARGSGMPYVLSPRGMLEPAALAHDRWRKRAAWQLFDRRIVEHASLLHATSPTELDTLQRTGRPVALIPNGVDIAGASSTQLNVRTRFAIPEGEPFVLFLGRIHPLKRLDLLAAAFALVLTRHPGARLVIAGPDESGTRASLAAQFAPIDRSVIWTGAVEGDVKESLLRGCSALVACSDSESFGMSVVEAMSAGAPVVVTRNLGWSDAAAEGAGMVVEQDAAAIARALDAVLDDPRKAEAMGARGRLLAARYSWPHVGAAMADAYQQLVRPIVQAS